MSGLPHALAGAWRSAPHGQPAKTRRVVVVGAAGPLGGEVLHQLIACGAFAEVLALVQRPIDVAMSGLRAVQVGSAGGPIAPARFAPGTDTAVIVFDRDGSRHGREAAFVRPLPDQLAALAAWLCEGGVRRLVLVLPQAPGLMPQALRQGLATLDEQAVAALGFEQLVLVRPTRHSPTSRHAGRSVLSALAHTLLAQLHWLLPQREQPLRAVKLAQMLTALVRQLPQARPGTQVLSPEALWDWAQPDGGERWLQAWLQGGPMPPVVLPARRW